MPGSFYEVLGIEADASPEDIRRAYKKRALQTHPDRLPAGSTADDKHTAAEQFRKVNNAYEILTDPNNRKLYDLYGVWPPPEELPEEPRRERTHLSGHRRSHGPFPDSDPFNDPLFNFPTSPFGDPFSHHRRPPVFRDPFELFNIIFADIERDIHHGHGPGTMFGHHPFDPFPPGPSSMFDRSHSLLRPAAFTPLSVFPAFPEFPALPDDHRRGSSRPNGRQTFSFQSSSHGAYRRGSEGQDPEWVSESRMTRTINGVTQSVWERIDRNGNKHVTYTSPDGREQYIVNGVEQPHPTAHIQEAPRARLSHPPVDPQYAPPPPFIPPEQGQGSSKRHWWRRHQ